MASLRGARGADRPGWHPLWGWHSKEKILWANSQIIVEKRGRTGKKRYGVTPWRAWHTDTRVKAIKSDSDSDSDEQKRSPGFQEKIKGWNPQLPPRMSPTLVTPLIMMIMKKFVLKTVKFHHIIKFQNFFPIVKWYSYSSYETLLHSFTVIRTTNKGLRPLTCLQ